MSPQSDSQVEASAGIEKELQSPREAVIADIAGIASRVDPSQGLTVRTYHQGGGFFSVSTIFKCGGWKALCAAAGVRSGRHVKRRRRRLNVEKRRERIIKDILRIAAKVDCSQGLTHRNYAATGGRFTPRQIAPCGGWKTVCRLAGVQWGMPRGARPARKPDPQALEALRTQVIDDIARVAGQVQHPKGLSSDRYCQAGGQFTMGTIYKLGRWKTLCDAAGVSAGIGGGQKKRLRKWRKTACSSDPSDMTFPQLDAFLDNALGIRKKPQGPTAVMGWNPRGARKGRVVRREVGTPKRSDIIADIRAIAWSQGLPSPDQLDWNTYRFNGGLYSLDETAAMGGFIALRRDAADNAD